MPSHDAAHWLRLSLAETARGDAAAALDCLARAVDAQPATASTWRDIGQAYAEHWRYDEAENALSRASALDPGAPATESLLALVRQEQGDLEGASRALERARARDPGDLGVALSEKLLLPQVYEDAADLARWRERYARGLAEVAADRRFLERPEAVFDLNRHNFLLAYQGEDDRELQRQYAALLGRLIGAARPRWREPRPIGFDGSRRLRVGFAGSIFRDCTAGRYFERWITGLDSRRFERFVYHTASVSDAFTRRIADACEHFAVMRGGAPETATAIEADALDVLVHPEVGMSAASYLLAAMRLAPVQAAGWGHPVTTGSDVIDWYFTCAAMEPADGDAHYVERLVRLPGLGVDYSMPSTPAAGTRAQLRLPEDARLYVCAQSLFKVHPDMDALIAGIAAADPQAVFAFFQAPSLRVTQALASRLQRSLAARGIAARGQLKFLPRMSGEAFRRVLALADVVLDTPRWSGGNTSIDAFAAGAPVVTLPGGFMRARQTAGMLGLMGVEGLAAASPDEYVRIATATAADRARNGSLRRAIAERRGALFDRREAVDAFSEALWRMGRGILIG